MRWILTLGIVVGLSSAAFFLWPRMPTEVRRIQSGIPTVSAGLPAEPGSSSPVESKWVYTRDPNDGRFKEHRKKLVARKGALHGLCIDRIVEMYDRRLGYAVQIHFSHESAARLLAQLPAHGFATRVLWRSDREIVSLFSTERMLPMTIWMGSREGADQLIEDLMHAAIDNDPVDHEWSQ